MMNLLTKLFCGVFYVAVLAGGVVKQPTLPIGECYVTDTVETKLFSFSCQLAAFGAYLSQKSEAVRLVLAPGEGILACSPLHVKNYSKFNRAAVLVRRGECSFQEKLAYVAATGATLMVLVNSEDAHVSLSSLDYQHSTAAALSVTQSDGDELIQMVKQTQIELRITETTNLASQARARLQFLVDINAPVSVYEEYEDVAEQLGGTLDDLLARILSENYECQDESKVKEMIKFFSSSAQQLSHWRFASHAAFHATVAAAVLQVQQWTQTSRRKGHDLLRAAAQKLIGLGYYSHSRSLLRKLSASKDAHKVQCLLSFLNFLQGNLVVSLSEATNCTASELNAGIPSLQVAQEAFNRLMKLRKSTHDEKCLELSAGLVNYTNLALTCCDLIENPKDHAVRQFSSEFTTELFHSLVLMGVFMDELGPFQESLKFFGYAARLCRGDRMTLELRQLLAVPVVFSSQNEMDSLIAEMKRKLHTFTETFSRQEVQEREVSPLGTAEDSTGETGPVLRPEHAAYLQYTITPSTMFIGYQGINVLPIQRAVNRLRSSVYPSLSSTFELQDSDRISHSGYIRRRIGFISTWFRVHSVGKLLLGIVQNLDRIKFHVAIYHCVHFLRDTDEITEAFKRSADEFVELPEKQDAAVQILRQARLDVVIFPELGMDEWTVLLSHHRVASIQCVFWGHPVTTGNPHIDYFISSKHFISDHFNDPVDESTDKKLTGYRRLQFSEQIVLFRSLSTVFTEPKLLVTDAKEITRSRLHLPTNRRLYVCPQTLMKLHPMFDEALAGILERDDKATVVLLASDTQFVWMEQVRRRFRQRFGRNHRRVLFLPTLPFAEFQALLALADVVLDPFPFGGGVTTLDALHLGIPVVTLPAAQSVVHLAAGFLRFMNASDCIAESLDEYVERAVNVAMDHEDIRERLLSHHSDIYQDDSTIEDWNMFLAAVTPRMSPPQ